jgi:hypothetical protein
MFMFGLVMLCQGLVQSWGGLMAARFFLGVFETGMFPGCMLRPAGACLFTSSQMGTNICCRFLSYGYVVQAE